jgi:hypothetical protein
MANLDALGVGRNPSDSHRFGDFGQKQAHIGVYTPIKPAFWPKPEKTSNWPISGHREDPDDGAGVDFHFRGCIKFNFIYNYLFSILFLNFFSVLLCSLLFDNNMVSQLLWKSCHRLGF